MKHYYEINKYSTSLNRALEAGLEKVIEGSIKFGSIQKITTRQDDKTGKYLEINIKFT
jgi:hypothetical protein